MSSQNILYFSGPMLFIVVDHEQYVHLFKINFFLFIARDLTYHLVHVNTLPLKHTSVLSINVVSLLVSVRANLCDSRSGDLYMTPIFPSNDYSYGNLIHSSTFSNPTSLGKGKRKATHLHLKSVLGFWTNCDILFRLFTGSAMPCSAVTIFLPSSAWQFLRGRAERVSSSLSTVVRSYSFVSDLLILRQFFFWKVIKIAVSIDLPLTHFVSSSTLPS